ncbi:MAG: helix-turn-helix domain-containing protein [Planctomycetales bacterium]
MAKSNECCLLTAKEVTGLLHIGKSSLWRLVAAGDLRVVRVSRQSVRFREADIERFIALRLEGSDE